MNRKPCFGCMLSFPLTASPEAQSASDTLSPVAMSTLDMCDLGEALMLLHQNGFNSMKTGPRKMKFQHLVLTWWLPARHYALLSVLIPY